MMEKNPIDKDKVAELPGLLEYAHHVGSALIKPEDSGKIKSRALTAMREQTNMQVKNIYEQMQVLANQMNDIKFYSVLFVIGVAVIYNLYWAAVVI